MLNSIVVNRIVTIMVENPHLQYSEECAEMKTDQVIRQPEAAEDATGASGRRTTASITT